MNMEKLQQQVEKRNSFRSDALRFFEWCRSNFNQHFEKLNYEDKQAFESGKISKNLSNAISATWSTTLKTHLPWSEHFAAVRKVLTDKNDYDLWMNCPMEKLNALPKRLHNLINEEEGRRLKEIHDSFFANEGESRLIEYLRVWQSQKQAENKLMIQAWGYKCKKKGGASIGSTEIDLEQMLLNEAEATGSAMKVMGLYHFIRTLWDDGKSFIVKTDGGTERKVVPNPAKSEERLNNFLIKLGQKLADTKNRRTLPDWTHMDQTLRLIVLGWCENIIVDNEQWPQLCFFTAPALADFLILCRPQRWKETQDPRTLDRAIQRLGLLKIPRRERIYCLKEN